MMISYLGKRKNKGQVHKGSANEATRQQLGKMRWVSAIARDRRAVASALQLTWRFPENDFYFPDFEPAVLA
jgi:hypothetical protein